jgi:hypothetical protein
MVAVGDRIRVLEGLGTEPDWTWGRGHIEGVVTAWFPRPDRRSACLVRLAEALPLTEPEAHFGSATGKYLVLRLRHKNAEWREKGVVHVEVFTVQPKKIEWESRDHWVDGRASYELVSTTE